MIATRLTEARDRLLELGPVRTPEHARAVLEIVCLQALEQLAAYPEAEQALAVALRLARDPLGPAGVLQRLGAWADEREAQGGLERPYTPAEERALVAARILRGEL